MIDADTLPLFDEARLDELSEVLGPDAVTTLLNAFDHELRTRPAIITDLVRRGDRDSVRKAAHLFRGAALSVGAAASAAAAHVLEQAGDATLEERSRQFGQTVERTRTMLSLLL